MKTKTALLCLCIASFSMTSCLESIPVKFGLCKGDVCANVEVIIPASKVEESGKEVEVVQPAE